MADTKITGLQTPQVTTNPATDVLPIVNIADNSMAASGSTRKITVNQLLGAGGTATLASATISGDLTVDTNVLKVDTTNNRVGIGTASPAETLTVAGKIRSVSSTFGLSDIIAETTAGTGTGYARLIVKTADREWRLINDASTSGSPFIIYDATANAESLRIATAGVYTFGDGAGGTRMTLNSTGLGVGVSPSYKLDVLGTGNAGILGVTTTGQVSSLRLRQTQNLGPNTRNWEIRTNGLAYGNLEFAVGASQQSDTYTAAMLLDSSGNLIVNGTTQFAKISSYVTNSGTFQSAFGATNSANSDFVVRIKTSVSDVYNSAGNITLSTGGSGGTERVRVKDSGQVRFVPLAADPSGAEAGDVYYNSTSNKLKCYNGTTWNDLF